MKTDSGIKTTDSNRKGSIVRPNLDVQQPDGMLNRTVTSGGGTADRRRAMLGVGTKKGY